MKVFVKKEHLEYLENVALNSNEERGGILIGFTKDDDYHVTHIIEDEKSLDRSSIHFTRITKNIWQELNELVKNNKEIDYIGEWHTHPKHFISPSKVDDHTILDIVGSSHYKNIDSVLLCISTGDNINFWKYNKINRIELQVSKDK